MVGLFVVPSHCCLSHIAISELFDTIPLDVGLGAFELTLLVFSLGGLPCMWIEALCLDSTIEQFSVQCTMYQYDHLELRRPLLNLYYSYLISEPRRILVVYMPAPLSVT